MKDLNLIPKSYILEKKAKKKKVIQTIIFSGVAFSLIASIAIPIVIRFGLQRERDSLVKKVQETSNFVTTEKQFDIIKNLFQLRENEGKRIGSFGQDVMGIWRKIEKACPEKLSIQTLDYSASKKNEAVIQLMGTAQSEDEIATFAGNLRSYEIFSSVTITSATDSTALNVTESKFNIGGKTVASSTKVNEFGVFNFQITLGIEGATTHEVAMIPYRNNLYGFRLDYPVEWSKKNGANNSNILFLSPVTGEKDTFCENVNITIEELQETNITVDQYFQKGMPALEKLAQFQLKETKDKELGGSPGKYMTYTATSSGRMLEFAQCFTIKDKKSYVLTLTAEPEQFNNQLKRFEEMLKSFKFVK